MASSIRQIASFNDGGLAGFICARVPSLMSLAALRVSNLAPTYSISSADRFW